MPASQQTSSRNGTAIDPSAACPRNAILHADALKALDGLPGGCIDLTVFSPPYDGIRDYGKNWSLDYKTLGAELFRATTDGGVCAVVIGVGARKSVESPTDKHEHRKHAHV